MFEDKSGIIASNDNANDQWEAKAGNQELTGTVVERISKDNLNYVTKPGCLHQNVRRDETEDDFVSFLCPDCNLGWLFQKPGVSS